MKLIHRALTAAVSVAALSACAASQSAVTYNGSPLARVGHPEGFRYSPAQEVKSGSCHVEISNPEIVAFGCPSSTGVFVEYSAQRKDEACSAFTAWARHFGAKAECETSEDGSANGAASMVVDGAKFDASLSGARLRVTHLQG